jgi:hypothetical protein
VQILNEFASVARRKILMSWSDVTEALDAFEFSVRLRCPSPLKCTKRHSKLRRSTGTTSMMRWSFPLHWKLDARLSIPKTFTIARQLMDNSPFEIPSSDHPHPGLGRKTVNLRESSSRASMLNAEEFQNRLVGCSRLVSLEDVAGVGNQRQLSSRDALSD